MQARKSSGPSHTRGEPRDIWRQASLEGTGYQIKGVDLFADISKVYHVAHTSQRYSLSRCRQIPRQKTGLVLWLRAGEGQCKFDIAASHCLILRIVDKRPGKPSPWQPDKPYPWQVLLDAYHCLRKLSGGMHIPRWMPEAMQNNCDSVRR
jgi:hypothetical protein